MQYEYEYESGFGNEFESEAPGYKGSIPKESINPQKCRYNLVAEQLSGTAFTAPRGTNRRTWFYRIKPSVCHGPLRKLEKQFDFESGRVDPNQRRWLPFTPEEGFGSKKVDFVRGLQLLAYSDQSSSSSISIFVYLCNANMINSSFTNSDGDFLIVPQEGSLTIQTEFGHLVVHPNEIAVIQQGMRFSMNYFDYEERTTNFFRGYVLEVKGNHFELPYLGPIGANGLANPRDFKVPKACVDSDNLYTTFEMVQKFQNELWAAEQKGSPYNVAGWFGNYAPYKYELNKFVSVNSVSVDHPDPSIFTVLTCPLVGKPGTALADFVIFPPRWECAEDTFRPPYYHRNCMMEFMGLIRGQYQAKSAKFAPGGATLHQSMMPHGPDKECFENASLENTRSPRRVADETMAFMFESSLSLKLTRWARESNTDNNYQKCWVEKENASTVIEL